MRASFGGMEENSSATTLAASPKHVTFPSLSETIQSYNPIPSAATGEVSVIKNSLQFQLNAPATESKVELLSLAQPLALDSHQEDQQAALMLAQNEQDSTSCELGVEVVTSEDSEEIDLDAIYRVIGNELKKAGIGNNIQLYLECDEDSQEGSMYQLDEISAQPPQMVIHLTHPEEECVPKPVLWCDHCTFSCSKLNRLLDHKATEHGIKGQFPCTLCDYKGRLSRHLQQHIKRQHKSMEKCSMDSPVVGGDQISQNQSFMAVYGKQYTSQPIQGSGANYNIPSSVLGKSVQVQESLVSAPGVDRVTDHSAVIKFSTNELYTSLEVESTSGKCDTDVCKPMLSPNSHLMIQNEEEIPLEDSRKTGSSQDNPSEKEWKCRKCSFCTSMSNVLKSHEGSVHGQERRTYSCSICGKFFYQKRSVENHIKQHSGKLDFQCHICSKKCASKSQLIEHSRAHTDVRPYTCNYSACGKKFKCKSDLNEHILTVHAVKQYSCTQKGCDRKYAIARDLKAHMVTHSNTYACQWKTCNKVFRDEYNLKCHHRTHTGEKPRKCDKCDYRCIQKASLSWHMKTKHA